MTSEASIRAPSPQLELNPNKIKMSPDQAAFKTVKEAIKREFEVGWYQRYFGRKLEPRAFDTQVSHVTRIDRAKSGHHD